MWNIVAINMIKLFILTTLHFNTYNRCQLEKYNVLIFKNIYYAKMLEYYIFILT